MTTTGDTQVNPDQLTAARVPLDEAGAVLSGKDAAGRTPIVILTTRQARIRNEFMMLALIVLVVGFLAGRFLENAWLPTISVPLALVLALLAIWRSFYVMIPEGSNALLARSGKHLRTVEGGSYVVPPWIRVTHVVTQRAIPFDAPVLQAPAADNVRVAVDVMVTFKITDPHRFVYSITADDFDLVLQGACQEALRGVIRRTPSNQISDLLGTETAELQTAINVATEQYGVSIVRVAITDALPPEDFFRAEEGRQLAILRRAEQVELQALAQRRQTDLEALEQQRVLAEVERERAALQLQVAQAEARKEIAEHEAAAESLRLERLDQRLRDFPLAVQHDTTMAQLAVARALASNSRVVLQANGLGELTRMAAMREMQNDQPSEPTNNA